MEDLSLHLLDLVENSLNAGANLVEIDIDEQPLADRMTVTINDNGKGMDAQTLARASDPFFTTRTTRRIGLGLSLIKANAEAWGGGMELSSAPGVGTRLHFWFQLGHIDRQPLGDWPGTLLGLIMSRPGWSLFIGTGWAKTISRWTPANCAGSLAPRPCKAPPWSICFGHRCAGPLMNWAQRPERESP